MINITLPFQADLRERDCLHDACVAMLLQNVQGASQQSSALPPRAPQEHQPQAWQFLATTAASDRGAQAAQAAAGVISPKQSDKAKQVPEQRRR